MFKRNEQHLQRQMFSTLDTLPENERERLEQSWAGTFYREFFCRIDEDIFRVLYSDVASRPNVPANILVALETLKAGHGWSDEEMIDAFYFDLQVRYALGLHNLGEQHFDIRTLYNFRSRLSEYMQETGDNPLDKTFEQVTGEQIAAFGLKTSDIRMDSTQVASNIREFSRLQLLVEVLQRVHRMLPEFDQERYAEPFAPYVKGSSGQYVYRVRSEEGASHIQRIGILMQQLVRELADRYADDQAYQILQRVFDEQFILEESLARPRQGKEFPSRTLQSPDDLDATFRRKREQAYTGYVTNVSETCHKDNDLQLIVKMQTAPNVIDDPVLLEEAMPDMERLGVRTLRTDGGYNNRQTAQSAGERGIEHIQTAIRGHSAKGLGLCHFQIEMSAAGTPVSITCPFGQKAPIQSKTPGQFIAHFDATRCDTCPLRGQCPSKPLRRWPKRALYFDSHGIEIARRRQRIDKEKHSGANPRAAVESTVKAIKHRFRKGKLPVRGLFRVTSMMLASGLMFNVRRIHRSLVRNTPELTGSPASAAATMPFESPILLFLRQLWSGLHLPDVRSVPANVSY
jgi:hypothetical protein